MVARLKPSGIDASALVLQPWSPDFSGNAVDDLKSEGPKMNAPIALGAETSPFRFRLHEKVNVVLNRQNYCGPIVSRCESHTAGIGYAVYAKYMHGTEAYWFPERDIEPAEKLDAGTTHKMRG